MASFSKNILTLSAGNVVAQAISLVAVPLITRLYAPAEFGFFSIYLAMILIILPIAGLRFEVASMLPESERDSAILLGTGVLSVILISILLAVLILTGLLKAVPAIAALEDLVWYLPLGLLIQGIAQAMSYRALKCKRFGSMTGAVIGESVVDRLTVLALGYTMSPGAVGLIAGRILGPFFGLTRLIGLDSLRELGAHFKGLHVNKWREILSPYRAFPLFSTWASLANSASREMPVIVLGFYFSSSVAGLYALAVRMMNLPMMLVGDAIAKAFFQKANEELNAGRSIGDLLLRIFGYMVYMGMAPALLLIFYGREIFSFIFGERWADAGLYTQVLMVAFYGMFVYRAVSTLFDLFNRQRARMIFDFSMFTLRIGVIVAVGALGGSVEAAIWALMLVTIFIYMLGIASLFRLVQIGTWKIVKLILHKGAVFLPLALGLLIMKFYAMSDLRTEIVFICILFFAQVVLAIGSDSWLREKIGHAMKARR